MGRRPTEDPRVTDLRRYRRAREQARRRPPRPDGRTPLLGSNPRARLILALVVLFMVAAWLGPKMLHA